MNITKHFLAKLQIIIEDFEFFSYYLGTTTCKNILFPAERLASRFYGFNAFRQKNEEWWTFFSGSVCVKLVSAIEISKDLYDVAENILLVNPSINKIFQPNPNTLNMRKAFFFIQNLPSNFIDEIWSDNPLLAKHLKNILDAYSVKEGNIFITPTSFLNFFSSLSSENQDKLCRYIADNYNDIS